MKRLESWSNVREFWNLINNSSSRVKNELKAIKFTLRKIEKKRIAVVYFRVYKRSSNSFGSRGVKSVSYATKVTNRRETRFRNSRNVIRHRESRIKDNTKVTSSNIGSFR